MEDFKHRRKKLEFWSLTGEVLGSNKYSKTQVWSSGGGGGGYVHPQHGGTINVSAPQVHSRSITHHEFWIKTPDGGEHSIQLVDSDIPLREGQKVTLISCGRKGKGSAYYTILVNHSARKHWFIRTASDLVRLLKLERNTVLLSVILLFLVGYFTTEVWVWRYWCSGGQGCSIAFLWSWIGGGSIFNMIWNSTRNLWDLMWVHAWWNIAGLAAGMFFIYRMVRLSRLKFRLTRRLETLAQEAYSSDRKA